MKTPRAHIILASGSPRRREILAAAGYRFDVITSDADESYDASFSPAEVAPYLARVKAAAVHESLESGQRAGAIVIGADTIVALGARIYGKPADEADACRILRELSGKTHQVITGVCVISEEETTSFAEVTHVTFRELDDTEIVAYVATGEPLDKAGAYGIQGEGARLIERTDGDFDNVVGLPITRLAPVLDALL